MQLANLRKIPIGGYGNLHEAVKQLKAKDAIELVIDIPQTLQGDLEIPGNIVLNIKPNAPINIPSGVTLTLNSQPIAGRYKIFDGEGTVAGTIKFYYPEWFGDSVTNNLNTTDASLGVNYGNSGFLKLHNGVIIQWGMLYITAGTVYTYTFPISFPNACLNAVASPTDTQDYDLGVENATKTGITIDNSKCPVSRNLTYIAIGH